MQESSEQESSDSSKVWKSGDTIAERYLLQEQLGEGGMGTVFKAQDLSLDKTVAVKTLLGSKMTDEDFVRFQREAQVASNIEHPNVVKIFDFGIDQKSKQPFLVMEYLSGLTLKKWLSRRKNPETVEVLDIVRQIARGMSVVHKDGIVHRDLKSSNIVVLEGEDGGIIARLLDFGAARAYKDENMLVTQHGMIIGTPKYLSPEQAQGLELDERSDIYSLGCIAFELFSGHPPFQGETAMDTIRMHITEPPPSLSDFGIEIDDSLENLLLKMLAKQPDDRIQSMDELIIAIDAMDASMNVSEPIAAREAPVSRGKSSFLFAGVVSAVVLLLLVPLVFLFNHLLDFDSGLDPKSRSTAAKKSDANSGAKSLDGNNEGLRVHTLDAPLLLDESKGGQSSIKSFLYLTATDASMLDDCVASKLKIPTIMVDKVKISDKDVESMMKLEPLWILFSRTAMVDRQLIMLSECKTLETLKFYRNPDITVEGIKALRSCPKLTNFSVRDCNIDDNCMKEIARFKHLKILDLEYNRKLTREGLMLLSQSPFLEVVSIYDTGIKVDAKQAEKLRKRLHLKQLYITTTFSSPRAIASVDEYRTNTIPGMGTGPIHMDLRQMYETKFQTTGKQ